MPKGRILRILAALTLCAALLIVRAVPVVEDELERGFLEPPRDARPHAYWLWPNGYVILKQSAKKRPLLGKSDRFPAPSICAQMDLLAMTGDIIPEIFQKL